MTIRKQDQNFYGYRNQDSQGCLVNGRGRNWTLAIGVQRFQSVLHTLKQTFKRQADERDNVRKDLYQESQ